MADLKTKPWFSLFHKEPRDLGSLVPFKQHQFYIHEKYASTFGSYMQFPPEDERAVTHDDELTMADGSGYHQLRFSWSD